MSEEDWGSRAAKRFRQQLDSHNQSKAALVQEDTIRQEQGPRLWAKVRESVKSLCDRFNTEFGSGIARFMVTPNTELHVQLTVPTGGTRELMARFKVTSADDALVWKTTGNKVDGEYGGEYALDIQQQGKVVFRGMIVETPEFIAEKMLDALLAE